MRHLTPIILAALLVAPASASEAQANENSPLAEMSSGFLEGYEVIDSLQVFDLILAELEQIDPQQSPFFASSRIRPLTTAVLALESGEGVRDRVRYRITNGIEQFPDNASGVPFPVSFIQVDRFSLGAAIREGVIASHGGEHVGPPEAFDVGPHVSWRLVTRPVQGMASDILAAGRTELSEAQARDMTCLGGPCLSPAMEIEAAAPWGPLEEVPLDAEPVPFQVVRSGLLTPAAAIDTLTRKSDFAEAGRFREMPESPSPFLEAVMEINLAQDSALDAAMRRGGLMDDSVGAIWRRLVIMPMGENAQTPTAYGTETFECRRGSQFPPDGGLCP